MPEVSRVLSITEVRVQRIVTTSLFFLKSKTDF